MVEEFAKRMVARLVVMLTLGFVFMVCWLVVVSHQRNRKMKLERKRYGLPTD